MAQSITTVEERAILDSILRKIIHTDPEAGIVFMDGLTMNEDWLMSGRFTVRARAGKLWLTNNGLHIGSWEESQAGELALWIAVHAEEFEDEDSLLS